MTVAATALLLARSRRIGLGENEMQFRLTYGGVLLGANNTNTRARHKHEIRMVFHEQLKHLWNVTPALKNRRNYPASGKLQNPLHIASEPWVEAVARNYSRDGYRFVPLVLEGLALSCRIDILFLRPDLPGSLIKSGDIDNRLKTLFDALRMPTNSSELGGYQPREGVDDPFFCLLEDDKLITHVSVETDVLHQPTGEKCDENDARLVISVTIMPASISPTNIDFL